MGFQFVSTHRRVEGKTGREVQVAPYLRFVRNDLSSPLLPPAPPPSEYPLREGGGKLPSDVAYFLVRYLELGKRKPFPFPEGKTSLHNEDRYGRTVKFTNPSVYPKTRIPQGAIQTALHFLFLELGNLCVYTAPFKTPRGIRFLFLLGKDEGGEVEVKAILLLREEEVLPCFASLYALSERR